MLDVVLEGVSKAFKEVVAVDNLTGQVRAGELYTILGHTGSGKTTLLRMIVGLEKPDRGKILIAGVPREKLPVGRGDVQIVFQDFALWPHMTVFQNLSFPLRQRKLRDEEIVRRVESVAGKVALTPSLLRRAPSQLSEGQKQQVAIGRALITNPKLLLLDEPFAHLDPITKLAVREELLGMQASEKTTVMMVTHQLSDALALADRVAVMHTGRLLQVAPPDELMAHPAHEYVEAYIKSYSLLPKRK